MSKVNDSGAVEAAGAAAQRNGDAVRLQDGAQMAGGELSEEGDWQVTTIDETQAALHPEVAEDVKAIGRLRKSIDRIDADIVELLAQRFTCTAQVGRLKADAGFAPEDRSREAAQRRQLERQAEQLDLDPDIARQYLHFVTTEVKKHHQCISAAQHR